MKRNSQKLLLLLAILSLWALAATASVQTKASNHSVAVHVKSTSLSSHTTVAEGSGMLPTRPPQKSVTAEGSGWPPMQPPHVVAEGSGWPPLQPPHVSMGA
jgi:hypothetical protein